MLSLALVRVNHNRRTGILVCCTTRPVEITQWHGQVNHLGGRAGGRSCFGGDFTACICQPDGLEWVAEEKGFIDTAQGPLYNIIPDYVLPGISNEAVATILAGMVGILIVVSSMLAVSLLKKNKASSRG